MMATQEGAGATSKPPLIEETEIPLCKVVYPNNGTTSPDSPRKSRHSKIPRSRLEVILLAVLTVLFLIVIVLVITTTVLSVQKDKLQTAYDEAQSICMTPPCIETASRMLSWMDRSVDPCEDFYQYACGQWRKTNVIPEAKSRYYTMGKLKDDMEVLLKGLLEDEMDESVKTNATVKTKHMYQSCMNVTRIEELDKTPMLELLAELGGWPVLHEESNWNSQYFDWIDLMTKLRLINRKVLIASWIGADDKNSSEYVLEIDEASLGLPDRTYYLDRPRSDPVLMAYENFAFKVAVMLGAATDRARREMTEMVDFEIKLANITSPKEQRRNSEKMYNKLTIDLLYTNVTSNIDWLRYFNGMFSAVNITLNRSEPVVLYAPRYMQDLAELVNDTPPRILANYMLWRLVRQRVINLSQRFLDARREYREVLLGVKKDKERWRICVSYVNNFFGMALGRMFVEEHFNEEAKRDAVELVHTIREAFDRLLETLDWMDGDTKHVAREKMTAMQEKIGYPDDIMNNETLDGYFEKITVDPNNYFKNVITNQRLHIIEGMQKLRKEVDKDSWSTPPATINAFYSVARNQIYFPAAILQPPFYHRYYPKSLQYGGIGMVIGHEMIHGFDDVGRQFDKDGNLKQWWTENVIDAFTTRAQCIIDQYSNYTVPEVNMNLNGIITLGENIADNGGLKQAFQGYRMWVEQNGKEEDPLPGINLSHNQLFFLNFAQVWCGHARPESYIYSLASSNHSPGKFRVLGPLSNSEDFAEAFQCRAGSRMNPVHKCSVW